MNCASYSELLIDQIAGELSEEDQVRLQQHLAECDDCVEEEARLRCVTEAALPAGDWSASEGIEARLLAELQERAAHRHAERPSVATSGGGFRDWMSALFGQPSRALTSATAVVCAIAIGFLLGQWRTGPSGDQERSPQAQPVREQIEENAAAEGRGLADRIGAIDDSLHRGGGAWTSRGWIRFATTPTDAISLAESFPTDTL